MRSKTIVTLVSAAGLLLALGLMVADAPVANAAAGTQTVAPGQRQAPLYVPSAVTMTAAERATFLRGIQAKVGSGLVATRMARTLGINRVQGKMVNVNRKVKSRGMRTDF